MNNIDYRHVSLVTRGNAATDGAGVQLTRIIGTADLKDLDPFLMLDLFQSDNPSEYIEGFPAHPHRGFETVTYMLAGKMRHKDNQNNEGVIEAGGVQWMTAGKGIIHSEMPEQTDGLLKGFQLWVNLPKAAKMVMPGYQEFGVDRIPIENRQGSEIKVITGKTSLGTIGPVVNNYIKPLMLDISLDKNQTFIEPIPEQNHSFVYVIEGTIEVDSAKKTSKLEQNQLGVLSEGDHIAIRSLQEGSQFLLLSASPINEPIARGGPFVMNSDDEIKQAFADYKNGRF